MKTLEDIIAKYLGDIETNITKQAYKYALFATKKIH